MRSKHRLSTLGLLTCAVLAALVSCSAQSNDSGQKVAPVLMLLVDTPFAAKSQVLGWPSGLVTRVVVRGLEKERLLGYAVVALDAPRHELWLRPGRLKPGVRGWLRQSLFYDGKPFIVKHTCFSGSAEEPEIALSPNGRYAACIDGPWPWPRNGQFRAQLILFDFAKFPNVKEAEVASDVDSPGVGAVAFFGNNRLGFLRYATNASCNSFNPLDEPTEAFVFNITSKMVSRLGCAQFLISHDKSAAALASPTGPGEWKYTLDGGQSWRQGKPLAAYGNSAIISSNGSIHFQSGPVDARLTFAASICPACD